MAAGTAATPAVRRGLRHDDANVRTSCCRVLDHFLDADAIPELMANLDHSDPSVRAWALHALACDRCKEGSCRPGEDESIPVALRMLLTDRSRKVRYSAIGLLGPAVHRRADVLAALEDVHRTDECPTNRKVAGWWLPGGPRYERTKPRPQRRPHAFRG